MSHVAFSEPIVESIPVAELQNLLLSHGQRPLLIYSCQLDGTDHGRLFIRYAIGYNQDGQETIPSARTDTPALDEGHDAPDASAATERPEKQLEEPSAPEVHYRQLFGPDITGDFITTLEALSPVGLPSNKLSDIFCQRLVSNIYTFIAATEDQIGAGRVCATASLIVERKLTHGGSYAGHIEDVAVSPLWQRRGLGSGMMRYTLKRAWELGCRKVVLTCAPELARFYSKFGFSTRGVFMRADRS